MVIRNSIVHRAGFVELENKPNQAVPKDKNFKKSFDRVALEGLSIYENGEIVVKPKFLNYMLAKVCEYLLDVCNSADEHFSRRDNSIRR